MKPRHFFLAIAAAGLAAAVSGVAGPLVAQDLERPEGWSVRFDDPSRSEADLEMFAAMPPGWHVTSGPAAIYWGPEMEASGSFRIELVVYLFDPGRRREAFGIFAGGKNLTDDGVAYSYFLIRNGGEYIVKRREGPEAPTVVPWTAHEAVMAFEDREEGAATIKNVLAIEVGETTVRFIVNGAEVTTLPRSEFPADGSYGFRINHGLNVHVESITAAPLGGGAGG